MKVAGNGQAAILSPEQLDLLFREGFTCSRDRLLFGICLYTACRISEALQLRVEDIGRETILFRKGNTKGKVRAREIVIAYPLKLLIEDYDFNSLGRIFPGRRDGKSFLSRNCADTIFRTACERVGIKGASTHSLRRTALTRMSLAGIPLRVIQRISGHSDLAALQAYLEVTQQQAAAAIQAICY